MMQVRPDDARVHWEGAVSVQHTPEWSQPWRLPYQEVALFQETLADRAAMPAGVRLTFRTDSTSLRGRITPQPESAPLDLFLDGVFQESAPLADQGAFTFQGLPGGEHVVELWLPQFGMFRLHALELDDGASLSEAPADRRPRWVTYGSSITQCRAAASPSRTWPAVVARARDLHLTCLGYGGQCHLDTMVARMIRDLPADYLSMCVGINIYGAASLGPRAFRPGIIGFVQIVRERHPDTPFVVMSPIYSEPRETTKNAVGFTLQAMREEVAEAVATLQAHGDRNVHYVNGLEVFGPDLAHLLPDNLHPNAEGYQRMGEQFAQTVAARYFG